MGTSSIFRGNNDRNPLLPSDYEEQTQIVEQPVTWKTVKPNKYLQTKHDNIQHRQNSKESAGHNQRRGK